MNPYEYADAQQRGGVSSSKWPFIKASSVRTAIANRLSFALDFTEMRSNIYESLLCFMVPYGSSSKLSEPVFNITSRHLPWEIGAAGFEHKQFPGGRNIFHAYNSLLSLDNLILAGEDTQSRAERSYYHTGTLNNGVCITGPYRSYNYLTQNFTTDHQGLGHFGEKALRGDARVRRGECISYNEARSQNGYGISQTDDRNLYYSMH